MQAPFLEFCRRETEAITNTVRLPGVSKRLASTIAQRCFSLPTLIEEAWQDVFDEMDKPGGAALQAIGEETMRVFAIAMQTIAEVTDIVETHQLFDESQRLEETAAKLKSMQESFVRQWPRPEALSKMEEESWAAYQRGECREVKEVIRELRNGVDSSRNGG